MKNLVGYSIPLVLLLTVCLFYAEHQSATQMHGNIDVDFIVSKQSGRFTRELAYIAIGAVGIFAIFNTLVTRRQRMQWNAHFAIPLGLLIVWSALSFLWTDMPEVTLKRLFVLALIFGGALGLAVSWSHTEILKFTAISAALQVGVGVVAEIVNGFFTPWQADYRFAGTLPWNSQGYLCLVLTLSALSVSRLKLPYRWLYQSLAVFGLVFLLLTRSRGALTALSLALILYFLLTVKLKRQVLIVLAVGAATALLFLSGLAPMLFKVLNRGGEGADNFTGRGPLWEELLTYANRRPWTGYGFEGFWTLDTIDDISGDQLWAIDNAHSGYLEGLLSLGYVGVVLHTLTLLAGMYEGIRLFRQTGGFVYFLGASLCFVYLVGGFLEALFIVKASQSSFYFAILLCVVAVRPKAGSGPSGTNLKRRPNISLSEVARAI